MDTNKQRTCAYVLSKKKIYFISNHNNITLLVLSYYATNKFELYMSSDNVLAYIINYQNNNSF